MNRKFNQLGGDSSLDLMLDVLSNVFGGVILISCLLAILPRHSTPPPLLPEAQAKSEMIERRIDAAKNQLEELEAKIKEMNDLSNPLLAELQQERQTLNEALKAIQVEVEELNERADLGAEIEAISALGSSDKMATRLRKIQQRLASEDNLNKAIQTKMTFLEGRLEKLNKQLKSTSEGRQYAVRFPREKGNNGNPFPIIVRYGRIYPLNVGKSFDPNPSIRRTPVGDDDAVIMKPVPGKGWVLPRDADLLKATLRAASGQRFYVTIYLYPDSHSVFNDLKTQIFAARIGYGLEFVSANRSLTFSSKGAKPPKL